MALELDDEDLEALGWGRIDEFDAHWSRERHIEVVEKLQTKRNRWAEKTPAYKWMRAAAKRAKYVPKPRVKLGGTWAERNPEAYAEAHRKAALSYYYRNRERIRAQQAEYRERRKREQEQKQVR